MKIYLASDHAGFELKEKVEAFLKSKGYEVEDVGPHEFVQTDDYPLLIHPAAVKIAKEPGSFGIVFGHSGQGEAMVANKVKGIRAVVYYGYNGEVISLSRDHNNANVLSIGAHFVTETEAQVAIETWLKREFTPEERHVRRVKEIKEIEDRW